MMTEYPAIIPIVIVGLSAAAAMLAEAFRQPGERMPIAGLGLIGLIGAAIASGFLWNSDARSMEGLLYAGTDDGLLQVTEDGGKNWRKTEDFPGVPKWTYVSDIFASPRDANTVFVALNNWQRGDYKPYLVKSTDKGRTWTSVAGNLPDRHG